MKTQTGSEECLWLNASADPSAKYPDCSDICSAFRQTVPLFLSNWNRFPVQKQ